MQVYRVWATDKSDCAGLLADSEADAKGHISIMRLFGDLPLSVELDRDNPHLPTTHVVHRFKTTPIPGRK